MKLSQFALILTTCGCLLLQEAAIASIFPMWFRGANTVPLDQHFKSLVPIPYSVCNGFYGCQRAACNASMQTDEMYVGMFFYSLASVDNCEVLDNYILAFNTLPSYFSWRVYRFFMYCAIIMSLFLYMMRSLDKNQPVVCEDKNHPSNTRWKRYWRAPQLFFLIASLAWYYYLYLLVVRTGETPPLFLTRSVQMFNLLLTCTVLIG